MTTVPHPASFRVLSRPLKYRSETPSQRPRVPHQPVLTGSTSNMVGFIVEFHKLLWTKRIDAANFSRKMSMALATSCSVQSRY